MKSNRNSQSYSPEFRESAVKLGVMVISGVQPD